MNVSIMQPNICMWCGLLKSLIDSDLHIIRDDVKSSKNSRYNRNKIAGNGPPIWFTIPYIKFKDSKLIYQQNLNTSKAVKKKMLSLFTQKYSEFPFFERTFNLINNTLSQKNDITPICEVYSSFIEELKIIGFPICRTVFASELILDTKNNNLIYGVEMVNFLLNKANAQTYLAAENTVKYAKPEEYKIRNVKIQKYFDKKYKNNFN